MGQPHIVLVVHRKNYYRKISRANTQVSGIYHHWLVGRRLVRFALKTLDVFAKQYEPPIGEGFEPRIGAIFNGQLPHHLVCGATMVEQALVGLYSHDLADDSWENVLPLSKDNPQILTRGPRTDPGWPDEGYTVIDARNLEDIGYCFCFPWAINDAPPFTPITGIERMELEYPPNGRWRGAAIAGLTPPWRRGIRVACTMNEIRNLGKKIARYRLIDRRTLLSFWPSLTQIDNVPEEPPIEVASPASQEEEAPAACR